MRVERFTGEAAEWDAFVRDRDGWTPFHLMAWKRVIESVFGHECVYLAVREADGRLDAVLPLVWVRSRVFGRYLVSMPFVNYGGPLGSAGGVRRLTERAVEVAGEQRADLLELRSRAALDVPLQASHRKVNVLLALPERDPDSLWKSLKAKVRSQVRRPQQEGITVRFGAAEVDPFYSVYSHHMRDLGTPTQSKRLFETLSDVFADDVWFGCAYLRGRPVAGGCGFRWGGEFEMTWASALRAHNRLAPNMLLYWSFMERCIEQGLRTFNFGRCTPGGGTHRFKRQWGGEDEQLWWYQHARGEKGTTPSPDNPSFAWGPRLWRSLPLAVANGLGPHIVRYIP